MDNILVDMSEYYDNEVSDIKRINFEIKLLNSKILNEYAKSKFDDYYEISKSICRVKAKLNRH